MFSRIIKNSKLVSHLLLRMDKSQKQQLIIISRFTMGTVLIRKLMNDKQLTNHALNTIRDIIDNANMCIMKDKTNNLSGKNNETLPSVRIDTHTSRYFSQRFQRIYFTIIVRWNEWPVGIAHNYTALFKRLEIH